MEPFGSRGCSPESTPAPRLVDLYALAQLRYQGDVERTARQLLTDFRKGQLSQSGIAASYPNLK
ncbi:MAG: hypothetical protein AB4352_10090 [Hormoscilla sp.]